VLNQEISGFVPAVPGMERHWLASWYPVVLRGGKPQYVGALVVDITERKRIEEELRASEDRFRSTFEQAAVGISHVGLDGRWLRVNNRLCEIVGYTREELLHMSFQQITHPQDMEPDLELVRKSVAGEVDGYHLEKRYLRKDGSIVWIQLTVSLVRDAHTHEPDHFISVIEDITSRKAAETQLMLLAESSNVLFPSLADERTLQAAADLLVPRLADWCVINLRHEEDGAIEPVAIAHRQPEKVAALRALAAAHPIADDQEAGTPMVIRTGTPFFLPQVGAEQLQSDGQLALLEGIGLASMMIVPMRARGQTFGAITLVRADRRYNYTDSDLRFAEELAQRIALAVDNASLFKSARDAEAQLRRLNESLEDRVAERTQELERSNRELDRFAYVASHDLKAPLRAIDNLSTWLYQDAFDLLPTASQEHLQKLRGRVRRMERLLDDLLAYSRAGRVQHALQEVDCDALVRSVFDLLAPPTGFRLTVHDALPVIYTQRVPLETVLRNLMGNAIKHHHRSDGHIEVSARWLDAEETIVEFSVRDDGPGMAAEYHERIFDLFQTLQPRDQVEGSGMGLAIVKKTVESVGGLISVDSTEGIGACFRFTWPAKQPEHEPVLN
jgi:PAS domain S-box-containing protein